MSLLDDYTHGWIRLPRWAKITWAICWLALIVLALSACGKQEPMEAELVFSGWMTYGGGGAIGRIQNIGSARADDVRVKSVPLNGPSITSSTTPQDINPGQYAEFVGPATQRNVKPAVAWIHWD